MSEGVCDVTIFPCPKPLLHENSQPFQVEKGMARDSLKHRQPLLMLGSWTDISLKKINNAVYKYSWRRRSTCIYESIA